jgi:hypothetical protein
MKKFGFYASLLVAGLMYTACASDDSDFDPQIVGEETETVTFEGSYFDGLIDSPQYGGPLLYGENAKNYSWTDPTTLLCGYMSNTWGGMYGYAEGGSAISNYIDANINESRDFNVQLAVPVSNGSKNFVVVFDNSSLVFADKEARVIKSMDVIGTTYALAVCKNGDGNDYAKALTELGDFYNVIVTGFNDGVETGTVTIGIARDGGFLDKWITKDMTPLGAVDSLAFSMDGSDKSNWGIKTPKYFAFDNVVIMK